MHPDIYAAKFKGIHGFADNLRQMKTTDIVSNGYMHLREFILSSNFFQSVWIKNILGCVVRKFGCSGFFKISSKFSYWNTILVTIGSRAFWLHKYDKWWMLIIYRHWMIIFVSSFLKTIISNLYMMRFSSRLFMNKIYFKR